MIKVKAFRCLTAHIVKENSLNFYPKSLASCINTYQVRTKQYAKNRSFQCKIQPLGPCLRNETYIDAMLDINKRRKKPLDR